MSAQGNLKIWSLGPNRVDEGGSTLYDASNSAKSAGDVLRE
jgi:hypothetical protein